MFELPTSLNIAGVDYNIRNKADYRVIIDCFIALDDIELTRQERIFSALVIFFEDINELEDLSIFEDNLEEAVQKMFLFFNCNQPLIDTPIGKYHLLDWESDAALISSAVNEVAHTEIRAVDYMHWWTFMAYYLGIKECALSTVLGIRYKVATNKKLEKHERKFRMDNPQYFTLNVRPLEEREEEEYYRNLWNRSSQEV